MKINNKTIYSVNRSIHELQLHLRIDKHTGISLINLAQSEASWNCRTRLCPTPTRRAPVQRPRVPSTVGRNPTIMEAGACALSGSCHGQSDLLGREARLDLQTVINSSLTDYRATKSLLCATPMGISLG